MRSCGVWLAKDGATKRVPRTVWLAMDVPVSEPHYPRERVPCTHRALYLPPSPVALPTGSYRGGPQAREGAAPLLRGSPAPRANSIPLKGGLGCVRRWAGVKRAPGNTIPHLRPTLEHPEAGRTKNMALHKACTTRYSPFSKNYLHYKRGTE